MSGSFKEFEKWCKEQIPESFDTKEIGIEERGMKKGWKGALEWVKRELPRAEAGFINPDLGLGEILKKELEE